MEYETLSQCICKNAYNRFYKYHKRHKDDTKDSTTQDESSEATKMILGPKITKISTTIIKNAKKNEQDVPREKFGKVTSITEKST